MEKRVKNVRWEIADAPALDGNVAIVTGANSGLGYFTSRGLASRGARVIMACRNTKKGEEARERMLKTNPDLDLEVWQLDLANLGSVREFATKFKDSFSQLNLLINNAGLMAIPYAKTEEGFEMQFGVNYLGHFALTSELWPLIHSKPQSRIVNVSSAAHRIGSIRFEDIHWEKKYRKWGAYGMSKLANLLFTYELARRLNQTGGSILAIAAHPGYASTELQAKGAKMKGAKLGAGIYKLANSILAQSAEMGALPTLFAATSMEVKQGGFYGPAGFMRMHGWPAPDRPGNRQVNDEISVRLWELSEQLTGCKIPI